MMHGLRLVLAPRAGRIRILSPVRFADGDELVSRGQAIAVVEGPHGDERVLSPVEARVEALLVVPGQPVRPGQPVMSLRVAAGDAEASG